MHQQLKSKNSVHYLTPAQANFEEAYIAVREKEGRVLTDEEVMLLPHLPFHHPRRKEWQKRNFTTQKALKYIAALNPNRLLDLGCGNGWFTNMLAQATTATVTGADINVLELEQAARLFESNSCHFVYGDIFSDQWPAAYFDTITLNACVQYFPDLDGLIHQLKQLLTDNGEIHFLDSPFYHTKEIEQAKKRTADYYQEQGVDKMTSFYHHHNWKNLDKYSSKILYQPNTFVNKLRKVIQGNTSPFPWIVIDKRS